MKRKRDDSLWKGILEDLFPEFLRFFFPKADTIFDMKAKFSFLDKELQELIPTPNPQQRVVDKLVSAKTKGGKEQLVLIHIEIQGYRDRHFPYRMFEYYSRLLTRYRRPVTAIAIFTDKRKTVRDYYAQEYLGTSILYKYNTYNIYNQSDGELKSSTNTFALIVLAAKTALLSGKMTDGELVKQHSWIFEALQAKKLPQRKIMSIWAFLVNCLQFADPETYRIFGKKLESITGKQNPMGVIEILKEQGRTEGIEKGRTEEQEKFIANLLDKLHLSDEQIADIAGVNLSFVKKVKRKLQKN